MNIPADLKYTQDHEWVRVEGDVAIIGVTDFAQGELGDVVFVEIETEGETLDKGFITLNNFETELPAFMEFLKSKNIRLKHMECRRKTLDDLFVSLTGRKINE